MGLKSIFSNFFGNSKKKEMSDQLLDACKHGRADVVRTLLDKGAKADIADKDGRTALHMASLYGHSNVVRTLLDKGAKTDIADKEEGMTALHFASFDGHADVVRTLLDKGAKADIADKNGRTALRIAITKGDVGVCLLLKQYGAK